MVIVYHGQDPDITARVRETKSFLDKKYSEVLGDARAQQVTQAADRLLKPQSFHHDVSTLNDLLGTDFGPDIPSRMPILCILRSDEFLNGAGLIRRQKARTSVVMYTSKVAHSHGGSARFTADPIASFVHEYNHFVFYVLQQQPSSLVAALMGGFTVESFVNMVSDELGRAIVDPEKVPRMQHTLYSALFKDYFEKTNRILDRLILSSIGIEAPIDWRGKVRGSVMMEHPVTHYTAMIPDFNGDPFRNFTDQETVEQMLSWNKFLRPRVAEQRVFSPYALDLLASVQNLRVTRLPIDEFRELEKRRK